LTTNALGNVAFVFNPYWLTNSTNLATHFGLNNNAALTGAGASNFFLGLDVGQTLPAPFYPKYRVVSSGLRLYCYPSSNNDNGIAVISVTFEEIVGALAGSALPGSAQFGDFNQIENGYYKQTTTLASREVQEHVYIPLDDSFFDYQTTAFTGKAGFAWTGYISGAAASSSIARVEVITNYEAVLDNQYTDYLPSETVSTEMEPKNIYPLVGKLKNLDKLNFKTITEQLREDNALYAPEDVLELPAPPKEKKKVESAIKELSSEISDVMKDFFPSVPKEKQSDWLSTVMDVVSPISSSIIQNVAGRYLPFVSPFFK